MGRILVVLVLISLYSADSTGQINVRRISVEEGLSSRRVWGLTFDDRGFLWVLTDNGLNRFNGFEFEVFNKYTYLPNEKGARRCFWLPDESKMLLTSRGNQYFERFDPRGGGVETINLNPANGFRGRYNGCAHQNQKQLIFLSHHASTYYFHHYRDGSFEILDSLVTDTPVFEFFWTDTLIWLNTDAGVGIFDRVRRELEVHDPASVQGGDYRFLEGLPLKVNIVRDQLQCAFHRIPGWYVYDRGKQIFHLLEGWEKDQIILYQNRDRYNNELTIYRGDNNSGSNLRLRIREHEYEEIFDARIKDKINFPEVVGKRFSENIWLATNNGILHLQFRKVKAFLKSSAETNQVKNISLLDGQRLLIITEQEGWQVLDTRNDRLEKYADWINHGRYHTARDIAMDSRKNLWGINRGNLLLVRPDDQVIREIIPPMPVETFALDRAGHPWVAAYQEDDRGALFRYDPVAGQFEQWFNLAGVNPVSESKANDMLFSKNGELWIATDDGLLGVDTVRRSFRRYAGLPIASGAYQAFSPIILHESRSGQLWLGTSNAGLLRFEPTTELWRQWTVRQGLCDDYICGILPDDKGNFWLSTFNGLAYFDTKGEIFHNFYEQDGLSQNEFNSSAGFRTARGRYFIGGINGIDAFYADELVNAGAPATLEISRVVSYDRRRQHLVTDLFVDRERTHVVLPARHRYLEVHVAFANPSDPGRGQFAYLLEGYHRSWQMNGGDNGLVFHYLPAGRYRLHIKGAYRSGLWSEPVILNFTVREFFFRSWWFILLCMLVAVLVGYLLHRQRTRQALRMARLRMDIAGDLHDEVGSNLTYLHNLFREPGFSSEKASGKLVDRALDVVQNSLATIRDVVWAIDSRNDNAINLADRMEDFLYQMLKPLGIRYELSTESLHQAGALNPFIRQHVYLIFKEAVTNVAKHAQASRVWVELNVRGNRVLELTIRDNGKGMVATPATSFGHGLNYMQRRADKLKALLRIDSAEGHGVTVFLHCPLIIEK